QKPRGRGDFPCARDRCPAPAPSLEQLTLSHRVHREPAQSSQWAARFPAIQSDRSHPMNKLFTILAGTFALVWATGGTATAAVTLNGSGSTFQKAFQEEAIEQFKKANAGVTINYGGGGSGKGRQDLADMVVDFAGADAAYKEADMAKI